MMLLGAPWMSGRREGWVGSGYGAREVKLGRLLVGGRVASRKCACADMEVMQLGGVGSAVCEVGGLVRVSRMPQERGFLETGNRPPDPGGDARLAPLATEPLPTKSASHLCPGVLTASTSSR